MRIKVCTTRVFMQTFSFVWYAKFTGCLLPQLIEMLYSIALYLSFNLLEFQVQESLEHQTKKIQRIILKIRKLSLLFLVQRFSSNPRNFFLRAGESSDFGAFGSWLLQSSVPPTKDFFFFSKSQDQPLVNLNLIIKLQSDLKQVPDHQSRAKLQSV